MAGEGSYGWFKAVWGWILLLLFLAGGCEDSSRVTSADAELERIALRQKIKLLEAAGEPVLVVGGETVSSEDVINAPIEMGSMLISPMERLEALARSSGLERFKERARSYVELALSARLTDILIYKLAKEQAGQDMEEALDRAAETEFRRFVLKFGGDEAQADEALKEMGLDRDSFKETQKRWLLTQSYIAKKLPGDRPVTYGELMDFYNKVKDELFVIPAMIQFRLIDIEPAKLELSDPNEGRLEQARRLADKLVGQIRAGVDFGQLALEYSHGHRQSFGGLWKPVQPGSLVKPYDVLAEKAEELQPGQMAGPIESGGHIFIMKLEQKRSRGYEPFEAVQTRLRQQIIAERRRSALARLNAGLMQQLKIGQKEEFVDFCLEKIYRISQK